MTGPKTNERPGTRATLKGYHMSASKARVVLNLIRGEDVQSAAEILAGTTREAADVIGKVLASAVANAVNNDSMNAEELYVSAAYADEGITMKRFTPRARGRAAKIRKRSCHITVIVSRLDEDRLELLRVARSAQAAASRSRRVASSRRRDEPVPAAQYDSAVQVEENDIVDSTVELDNVETAADEVGAQVIENEETVGETNEDETVSDDTTEETK
ncbi:MAG: 50S ribosomal protein L22 [Acidimicrobiaceae bacterium]|nr:50S ribosomal protein L22 [Acidimicrobiaceae bacterium]